MKENHDPLIDKWNTRILDCIENSLEFLESAEILITNGKNAVAHHLLVLSAEEIGKSLLIKEMLKNPKDFNKSDFHNSLNHHPTKLDSFCNLFKLDDNSKKDFHRSLHKSRLFASYTFAIDFQESQVNYKNENYEKFNEELLYFVKRAYLLMDVSSYLSNRLIHFSIILFSYESPIKFLKLFT